MELYLNFPILLHSLVLKRGERKFYRYFIWPNYEAERSHGPVNSTEAKNTWGYTSTPPIPYYSVVHK
jgi:hypothetical protein